MIKMRKSKRDIETFTMTIKNKTAFYILQPVERGPLSWHMELPASRPYSLSVEWKILSSLSLAIQ
jgi:hypothetical protein